MVRVQRLTFQDVEEVLDMYAHFFRFDEYYQKLFGSTDCAEDIKEHFRADVENGVLSGYAFGIYQRGNLKGFVLACNINDWMHNHVVAYNHLFRFNGKDSEAWVEDVKQAMRLTNSNLCYIYAACSSDNVILSKLIGHLVSSYGDRLVIFTDILTKQVVSACQRYNFEEMKTEGGNTFVIRK